MKPRSGPSCHWSAIGPSDNGDGYVSAEREAAFTGPGKVWGVMRKAPKGGELHPVDAQINRRIAMVRARARVEHPFRVIKRKFGHAKTRYKGLARNRAFGAALGPMALAPHSSPCSHSATCSWCDES